jgi:STE24 endopeptidase
VTRRRQPRQPIAIPGLDVPKARRYSRTRLAVLLASTAWGFAQLAWFARNRRSLRLKTAIAGRVPDARLTAPAYFGATSVLSWLAGLPLGLVGGWLVERRFGLSKQPLRGWFADQAKGLALSLVLQPALLTGAWAVIRRRPRDWWLVLAGLAVPLSVAFGYLAPVLVMPLFNRFTPLRDRDLAERVKRLADRAGVRVADVYEIDMSRRSEKPNAFFAGIGRSKRIALGDTLLEKFPPAEVEGVVGHELGHQANGDIWRFVGFAGAVGFGTAWALSILAPRAVGATTGATGVDDIGDEASFPVVALVAGALGFAVGPAQAAFSRAIERRTDAYALELTGDGDAYASAMARLAAAALADPDPPRPLVWLLYSHPPIADRIRAARAFADTRRTESPT